MKVMKQGDNITTMYTAMYLYLPAVYSLKCNFCFNRALHACLYASFERLRKDILLPDSLMPNFQQSFLCPCIWTASISGKKKKKKVQGMHCKCWVWIGEFHNYPERQEQGHQCYLLSYTYSHSNTSILECSVSGVWIWISPKAADSPDICVLV